MRSGSTPDADAPAPDADAAADPDATGRADADRRDLTALAVGLLALAATAALAFHLGYLPGPQYDRATVTVADADDGATVATVDARVADTFAERYRGLSGTDSLAPGEGMLFVHDSAGEHAYVMRGMEYPIDIVFVGADGRVTAVRGASVPDAPDGDLRRYRGEGKYVLELPRGYADRVGISVGDRVTIRRR